MTIMDCLLFVVLINKYYSYYILLTDLKLKQNQIGVMFKTIK